MLIRKTMGGPRRVVVTMEKLALVGNYLNSRMRRLRTGDLSPWHSGGELCFAREKVRKSHKGYVINTVPALSVSVKWDPCVRCLEKLPKYPHTWGRLYIMYDSHLNSAITGKGCRRVSFKCCGEHAARLLKSTVISYFYASPWKSQCDTAIKRAAFLPPHPPPAQSR